MFRNQQPVRGSLDTLTDICITMVCSLVLGGALYRFSC